MTISHFCHPNIPPVQALPVLCGHIGTRFGDWTLRFQPYRARNSCTRLGSTRVQGRGSPSGGAPINGVPITSCAGPHQGDAVFEAGRMPGRYPTLNPAILNRFYGQPLEVPLANGRAGRWPRRSAAVDVPHSQCGRPRSEPSPSSPGDHKFLAHSYVFGLHRKQLLAVLSVDTGLDFMRLSCHIALQTQARAKTTEIFRIA